MKQSLLAWCMIALLMTSFTACEIPTKRLSPYYGEILALLGGGIHCVTQQQPLF